MKKALIGLVLAAMLFGPAALAENSERAEKGAGIVPGSVLYFLDRAIEIVQESAIGAFGGDEAKIDFLVKLAKEREAEAAALGKKKGTGDSEEGRRAMGLRADHLAEISSLARKKRLELGIEVSETATGRLYFDPSLYYSDSDLTGLRNELNDLLVKKQELRKSIAAARDAGETAEAGALLKELIETKKKYDRLAVLAAQERSSGELEAEKIENLFTLKDQAKLALIRAEIAKKRIRKEAEAAGLPVSESDTADLDAIIRQATEILQQEKAEELAVAADKLKTSTRETERAASKRLREDEEKNKLPEERLAEGQAVPEAEKKPESAPAEKPAPKTAPAPQKQAPPPELGSPGTSQLGGPIVFNPLTQFQVTLGDTLEYSFCQPATARTSDLCTAAATNPTGGQPPYHFQLGSGGFLPFGMTLNLNGLMKGAPNAVGQTSFSVCAVDLAGLSACRTIAIIVNPKQQVPVAAPPPADAPPSTDNDCGDRWQACLAANCTPPIQACYADPSPNVDTDACDYTYCLCYNDCLKQLPCMAQNYRQCS